MLKSKNTTIRWLAAFALSALILVSCALDEPLDAAAAEAGATPAAIAATEQATAEPPAPTVGAPDSPLAAPAPQSATDTAYATPGVVALMRLVGEPDRILDFRRDAATGRLFITTTDGKLTVLDGATLNVLTEFPFGGELTLDAAGRRLYAGPGSQFAPEGEPISVRVVDMDGLTVLVELVGVHAVSVDRKNNRLFAGSPVRAVDDERGSKTVRVYDLDSLELRSELDQQGIPTYNPYRDELLVTAYTALVLDPDTGEVLEDLLPELADQPFPWCNGCEYAAGAHVVEPQGLLVIERAKFSTGGGPGFSPQARYLDASTLQEIDRVRAALALPTGLQHAAHTRYRPSTAASSGNSTSCAMSSTATSTCTTWTATWRPGATVSSLPISIPTRTKRILPRATCWIWIA